MRRSESRKSQKLSLDPLDRFPEAILCRIFKQAIAAKRGCGSLPLVSRRWNKFLSQPSELWKSFSLRLVSTSRISSDPTWSRTLLWLAKRLPGVRNLKVPFDTRRNIQYDPSPENGTIWAPLLLLLLQSNLTGLEAVVPNLTCREKLGADSLLLIGQLTTLEALQLSAVPAPPGLQYLSSLTRLRELILQVDWTSTDIFPSGLSCLTALEKLAVWSTGSRLTVKDEPGSMGIAGYFSNLKELAFSNAKLPPAYLQHLTALTRLELQEGDKGEACCLNLPTTLRWAAVSESYYRSLAVATAVRQLQLCYRGRRVPVEDLGLVVKGMSQLEYLELPATPHGGFPPAIAALTSLKVLYRVGATPMEQGSSFSFPAGPYLAGLQALGLGLLKRIPPALAGAPQLRILDASDVGVFDQSSVKVVLSLPGLRDLYLPPNLSTAGYEGLVQLTKEAPWVKLKFAAPRSPMGKQCLLALPRMGLSPCYRTE